MGVRDGFEFGLGDLLSQPLFIGGFGDALHRGAAGIGRMIRPAPFVLQDKDKASGEGLGNHKPKNDLGLDYLNAPKAENEWGGLTSPAEFLQESRIRGVGSPGV